MAATILRFPGASAVAGVPRRQDLRNLSEFPAVALLRLWLTRIAARHRLAAELLPQPDAVLADVGLTREALVAEIRKPFWMA